MYFLSILFWFWIALSYARHDSFCPYPPSSLVHMIHISNLIAVHDIIFYSIKLFDFILASVAIIFVL